MHQLQSESRFPDGKRHKRYRPLVRTIRGWQQGLSKAHLREGRSQMENAILFWTNWWNPVGDKCQTLL